MYTDLYNFIAEFGNYGMNKSFYPYGPLHSSEFIYSRSYVYMYIYAESNIILITYTFQTDCTRKLLC